MLDWLSMTFGWSDLIAFILGCAITIVWKNIWAYRHNSHCSRSDKVNLPKLNRKWLVWCFTLLAILAVFWMQIENGRAQHDLAIETHAIAVRTCEDSKVSSIERNGLQTLLIASMNDPRAKLPPNDPVRQEWGRKLGLDYLGMLDEAGKARRAIRDGGHVSSALWAKYMGNQVEPKC